VVGRYQRFVVLNIVFYLPNNTALLPKIVISLYVACFVCHLIMLLVTEDYVASNGCMVSE